MPSPTGLGCRGPWEQAPRRLCGALGTLLTYAVQPVHGHRLKGPAHHGILLQHLVEIIHRQGVEAAVGVSSHAGRPPAPCQQADLCRATGLGLSTTQPFTPFPTASPDNSSRSGDGLPGARALRSDRAWLRRRDRPRESAQPQCPQPGTAFSSLLGPRDALGMAAGAARPVSLPDLCL